MSSSEERESLSWRSRLQAFGGEWVFYDPSPPEEIEEAEQILGVKFPRELRELLSETNGVMRETGVWKIWSVQEIRDENIRMREEGRSLFYMSFDRLLFFSHIVTSDCFGFPIMPSGEVRTVVFVWDHDEDTRKWVATSLSQYVEWMIQDKIQW